MPAPDESPACPLCGAAGAAFLARIGGNLPQPSKTGGGPPAPPVGARRPRREAPGTAQPPATRRLFHCRACDLRFVPAAEHIPPEAERARYLLHHNSADDAGYVRWLSQAVAALERQRPRLPAGARVLDYGSGPTPVLVELLRKAGWDATGYDPFFAPDADLSRPFNAVVSTETFEHFRQPREETGRVLRLLAPGGVLVVMTSLCDAVTDWPRWHYARDETHVAFYSTRTFAHLAAARGLMPIENNGRNVVVLQS